MFQVSGLIGTVSVCFALKMCYIICLHLEFFSTVDTFENKSRSLVLFKSGSFQSDPDQDIPSDP